MNRNSEIVNSKREWYTIDELIGMSVDGLKGSKATIHRRAVKEEWVKRQREGVKGVAFEYHVSSLPPATQIALGVDLQPPVLNEHKTGQTKVLSELISMLESLTDIEQRELAYTLKRKGVEIVLFLLDESNIRLLQLPEEERERLLVRHEAKKGASEDSQGNDFTDPMSKQAG